MSDAPFQAAVGGWTVAEDLESLLRQAVAAGLDAVGLAAEAPNVSAALVDFGDETIAQTPTGTPVGASLNGMVPRYTASVVKLFHMAALYSRVDHDRLALDAEDHRALEAMIRRSSNNATSHVVDRITDTLHGPMPADAADYDAWCQQRLALDRWLDRFGWPESAGCRICHKTYDDSPYGREQLFRVAIGGNRLTSDCVARMLLAVARDGHWSAPSRVAMLDLLDRAWARALPDLGGEEGQVAEFIGEAVPPTCRVWSKAGWTSTTRHDAALLGPQGGAPRYALVILGESRALAQSLTYIPAIAGAVVRQLIPA